MTDRQIALTDELHVCAGPVLGSPVLGSPVLGGPASGSPLGDDALDGRAVLGLAVRAARAAAAKTLEETVLLDVGDLLGITDYFVVSAGRNDRQVRAIVDEVHRAVREAGGTSVRRVEGLAEAEWVLVDYGSFVVHVFDVAARERFSLERLWADAPHVGWEPALASGTTR